PTGAAAGAPDTRPLPVAPPQTGPLTLSVNLTTNSFVRTSGSFLADGFAVGQEVHTFGFEINLGTYHVVAVTATSLTVEETLLPGDTTGDGDERIVSPGKVVIAGTVGGGGLTNVTFEAEDTIALLDGAVVSTR